MGLLRRYDLSDRELDRIKRRIRAPAFYTPGVDPILDQHILARTNDAWRAWADHNNVDWTTIRPAPGYGESVILAEPKEPQ